MVKISETILSKLKCFHCGEYLSCGPVWLMSSGKSICGRCSMSGEQSIRNGPYEEIAGVLEFPCRYQPNGCKQFLQFSKVIEHENVCQYQEHPCPFTNLSECQWKGINQNLLEHCEEEHSTDVLKHPCAIKYNNKDTSLQTFIATAFNVFFFIHVKVCLAGNKIFHCVRLMSDPDEPSNYEYTINIKGNKGKISKVGTVVSFNNLEVVENNSLSFKIDMLQDILGPIEDLMSSIVLKQVVINEKNLLSPIRCPSCYIVVTQYTYRDCIGWYCQVCIPKAEQSCERHYCSVFDIEIKRQKHRDYFCNNCQICEQNVGTNIVRTHILGKHSYLIYENSKCFRVQLCTRKQYCIINTEFGLVFCQYYIILSTNCCIYFFIELLAPIPYNELNLYNCHIQFSNETTGEIKAENPDIIYTSCYDWNAKFKVKQNNGFLNLKIDFNKKIKKTLKNY